MIIVIPTGGTVGLAEWIINNTNLSVPEATILGKPEMFVDVGSTINITCVVKHTPGPPSIVQWRYGGKVSQVHSHNESLV